MSHILKKYSRKIDYSHDIVTEIIESQHFFASNCRYIAKNRAVALAASERNAVVMLSDVRRCQVCKTLAASGRIDLATRQGTSLAGRALGFRDTRSLEPFRASPDTHPAEEICTLYL